jgi:rod shape-determining protein MreB
MVKRRYGVVLFSGEAERFTRGIGLADGSGEAMAFSPPAGLCSLNGRERSVIVSGEEVFEAVRPILSVIMETITRSFRRLPPKIAAEVIESGICLVGGGACLPGMKESISKLTSIDVKIPPDPLHAVINGASQMLDVGESTGLWDSECAMSMY